jgi:hypothetical protein
MLCIQTYGRHAGLGFIGCATCVRYTGSYSRQSKTDASCRIQGKQKSAPCSIQCCMNASQTKDSECRVCKRNKWIYHVTTTKRDLRFATNSMWGQGPAFCTPVSQSACRAGNHVVSLLKLQIYLKPQFSIGRAAALAELQGLETPTLATTTCR